MKIALFGYGKMGKTIERLAVQKNHEIVFTTDGKEPTGDLKNADVAIDFSTPEAAFSNIELCLTEDIPVISGTTGWLDRYSEILNICESRNGTFLYASNFSIGVNLFFKLNNELSKLMSEWSDYKIDLEEIHHTQKKDAPSGTAISIAEGIIGNSEMKGWQLGETSDDTIGIEAKREGDVKGTHIVSYKSDIDSISIKHEAHSRDGFAMGAILAAEWIREKKGVYSMRDVLGIDA